MSPFKKKALWQNEKFLQGGFLTLLCVIAVGIFITSLKVDTESFSVASAETMNNIAPAAYSVQYHDILNEDLGRADLTKTISQLQIQQYRSNNCVITIYFKNENALPYKDIRKVTFRERHPVVMDQKSPKFAKILQNKSAQQKCLNNHKFGAQMRVALLSH